MPWSPPAARLLLTGEIIAVLFYQGNSTACIFSVPKAKIAFLQAKLASAARHSCASLACICKSATIS
jgi:hypothetical protein